MKVTDNLAKGTTSSAAVSHALCILGVAVISLIGLAAIWEKLDR